MTSALPPKNLPILLGALRQESADGELVLEQNDGTRRLYFGKGELVHLKSDVAGEQFGNYLLRQGILDFKALSELLANDERYRIGEKVIQWGMMSLEERDCHLQSLQEQILIHALEHPIHTWTWTAGSMEKSLEQDLHFKLQHRHFIWNTFLESNYLMDLLSILEAEKDWRWEGRRDLLDNLSDLPLTPGTAYALSFLGADPISFDTFLSLSNLDEEEAGRFIATLWALGALVLTGGRLPTLARPEPEPAPAPKAVLPPLDFGPARNMPSVVPAKSQMASQLLGAGSEKHALPFIQPPAGTPPKTRLPPLEDYTQLDPLPLRPEFLDPDPEPEKPLPPPPAVHRAPAETRPAPPPPAAPAKHRADPFAKPEPQAPAPAAPPIPLAPMAPPPPPMPPPKAEEGPARARTLVRQARQQVQVDRTIEAIRTLEQAVKLEPDADVAYEAWLLLGQLRLANPAWSTRAIDALQNASSLKPKAAEPWATMGELYHRKGFQANAAACYRRALELNPAVPIPPDVDLEVKEQPLGQPVAKRKQGLFGKVRSILGGSEES